MATRKSTKKAASQRPNDSDMVKTIAERGTEREKIAEIETAIARADKKRESNKAAKEHLDTELTSIEAKLSEMMHAHYEELAPEEDGKGTKLRVYRRGEFYAVIAAKESIKYDIIKPKPQGTSA